MISHWDDVQAVRRERGHIGGDWQSLTGEASEWVGVKRIRIDPGKWSTPLHLEGSEEELFFVLSGSGVSVQRDGSNEGAYAVGEGDCLVHLALEHAHTLQAGPDGLEVLAYGERHYAANTLLPRAGRLVARPDVGPRGRARRPSLEAGGCCGASFDRRAGRAAGAHRQRRRRQAGGA